MNAREHFIAQVMALPDLEVLPDNAVLMDICKCKGEFYVYYNEWVKLDDALKAGMSVQI